MQNDGYILQSWKHLKDLHARIVFNLSRHGGEGLLIGKLEGEGRSWCLWSILAFVISWIKSLAWCAIFKLLDVRADVRLNGSQNEVRFISHAHEPCPLFNLIKCCKIDNRISKNVGLMHFHFLWLFLAATVHQCRSRINMACPRNLLSLLNKFKLISIAVERNWLMDWSVGWPPLHLTAYTIYTSRSKLNKTASNIHLFCLGAALTFSI